MENPALIPGFWKLAGRFRREGAGQIRGVGRIGIDRQAVCDEHLGIGDGGCAFPTWNAFVRTGRAAIERRGRKARVSGHSAVKSNH